MYSAHICSAAGALAENMRTAQIPMYGQHLRLPGRSAIIAILKDLRRLMFPAYFGDEELMALEPENYAALLMERIEKQLAAQIALALPEEKAACARVLAGQIIERLPAIQATLLTDVEAIFDGDPAAQNLSLIHISEPTRPY